MTVANYISLFSTFFIDSYSVDILCLLKQKKQAIYQEKSNLVVKMNICDLRLIVVQYDPVDFIFTRLSLL